MRTHCTVIPTLSESLLPIGSAGRVLLILCHIFIATSIIELASRIQTCFQKISAFLIVVLGLRNNRLVHLKPAHFILLIIR